MAGELHTEPPLDPLARVTARLLRFRDERDWSRFHTPKELSIALSIEASELLEHFRWLTAAETSRYVERERDAIADELADITAFLIYLAEALEVDLLKALERKIDQNDERYPVDRAHGVHTKYSKFEG